jgi:hypothetical protein
LSSVFHIKKNSINVYHYRSIQDLLRSYVDRGLKLLKRPSCRSIEFEIMVSCIAVKHCRCIIAFISVRLSVSRFWDGVKVASAA